MYKRKPFLSLSIILLNWIAVFLLVFTAYFLDIWFIHVLVFILVGAQQHGLSLWLHEGAHGFFIRRKDINDLICHIFLAAPLFITLDTYRRRHFKHHKYLGTPEDTKQVIYSKVDGLNFLKFFISGIFGIRAIELAKGYIDEFNVNSDDENIKNKNLGSIISILIVQVCLYFAMYQIGGVETYFIYWLLPFITVTQLLTSLRAITEHQPGINDPVHPFTRDLQPTLIDRVLFCRAGFQYHKYHHEFPDVPCFYLFEKSNENHDREPKSYLEALSDLILQR